MSDGSAMSRPSVIKYRSSRNNIQHIHTEKFREDFINGAVDLTNINPSETIVLLRIAVTKDDTTYAISILDQIPGILKHDDGGGKLLWQALENENKKLALELIVAGADVNYQSRNGSSVMHTFMGKFEKIAAFMIEKGADINLRNRSNKTVLYMAVQNGLKRVIGEISKLDLVYEDEDEILRLITMNTELVYLIPPLINTADIAKKKLRARTVIRRYLEVRTPDAIDMNMMKIFISMALSPSHTDAEIMTILKSIVVLREHADVVRLLLDYHTSLGM